jgi:hypothetical protein
MKKIWTLLGLVVPALVFVAFSSACNPVSLSVTVEAQTLPLTKTLAWDAEAAAFNVTNYTVSLDGTVIGNPTGTTQAVTFTTLGTHMLTVTSTNVFGVSGPASLTVNVVAPPPPANLKLQ